MKRRDFLLRSVAGAALAGVSRMAVGRPTAAADLPRDLSPAVPAVLRRLLGRDPAEQNTDWDGTMAMEALLHWSRRGVPQGRAVAEQWFAHHLAHDPKLTDEELHRTYRGPRCRVIRTGPLPFTTYCGFYGLPFPCHELHALSGDPRAREVCRSVADAILHVAARESHGLVLHDDGIRNGEQHRFTIPDTLYFVVRALMIGATIDAELGAVYRRQALLQIRTGTDIFLDREHGLARTVLASSGLGHTYWCRASGWLMYALTGVLRYLPADDPEVRALSRDLKTLADGVVAAAGPSGGLRVLINDTKTPEETTGTAMCLAGIREGVRRGWLPDNYGAFCTRAWEFVQGQVEPDGLLRNVSTGWALTAEQGRILMDQGPRDRGWIPAIFLFAALEMSAP